MKKLFLLVLFAISTTFIYGQATRQLNFGGLGTGLYVAYDIPIVPVIAITPTYKTNWDFDRHVLAVAGNFYFDDLFGLNEAWDVYGGVNGGWNLGDNGGFDWGLQAGGRWFWNERWGLNAQIGGGKAVDGGIGVTLRL